MMNRNIAWSEQMNTFLKFVELSDCYTLIHAKSTLEDVSRYEFWKSNLSCGIIANNQTYLIKLVSPLDLLSMSFNKSPKLISNFKYK